MALDTRPAPGSTEFASRRERSQAIAGERTVGSTLVRLGLVLGALTASMALSQVIEVPRSVYLTATAAHVVALMAAFGAVLVIDWYGVLWVLGSRRLSDSLSVSAAVDPVIWIGLSGVLATGALLQPDLSSDLTRIKMGAVALVMINGVLAGRLRRHLRAQPADVQIWNLPPRLLTRLMMATMCSQLGWWSAIVIGFINDAARRG